MDTGAQLAQRLLQYRDEASLAVAEGDYDTAYQKLLAAQVLYDTTPNQTREGAALEFRSIEDLMRRIDRLRYQAAVGKGIQSVKLQYARPTLENE